MRILRLTLYLFVALLAVGAVMAVLAPAQWLADRIRAATAEHVELADASGSIWSGQATLVLTSGDARASTRTSLPDPVRWTLAFWPLLKGTIEVTLTHPSALSQPLTARTTLDKRTELGPAALRLPAAMLIGLGAPWNTIRPSGVLLLSWDRLSIAPGSAKGNFSAE